MPGTSRLVLQPQDKNIDLGKAIFGSRYYVGSMSGSEDDPLWEGDVNDAVVEEWKAETTPFGRVREVLLATTDPQYAGELAERARVSEPTARKHLRALAEAGFATGVETGRGTRYKRSRQTVAMRRISDLHARLSREELVAGIKRLRGEVRSYQEEYDATDPDDLALQTESDDGDAWAAVRDWRALNRSLDVAQAALALYDFDPDDGGDGSGVGADDHGTRGALAPEDDTGASA